MTMTATARAFGVARSLAMYYGIPFRARRLRRFYSEFVHAGDLCFDVGAHVGNRVRCWRRLGARVVAIEPQADFVRVLRWLYGNDAQVEIVPLAVGRAAGSAELLVSERQAADRKPPLVCVLKLDVFKPLRSSTRAKAARRSLGEGGTPAWRQAAGPTSSMKP